MRGRLVAVSFAGAMAAMLSACGGAATPRSQEQVICGLAPPAPSLVYPIDGAVNVPDGNFTLLLTSSATPVSLLVANATVFADLPPTTIPSPLPSPAATASPHAGYAVPKLQPSTTYEVVGVYPVSGCHPIDYTPPPQPIGSFTTSSS